MPGATTSISQANHTWWPAECQLPLTQLSLAPWNENTRYLCYTSQSYNGKSPTPNAHAKNTQLNNIITSWTLGQIYHYTILPIFEVPSYLWLLQATWVYSIFNLFFIHLLSPSSSLSSSTLPPLKFPAPPSPSTAQSQALAFIWLKILPDIAWVHDLLLVRAPLWLPPCLVYKIIQIYRKYKQWSITGTYFINYLSIQEAKAGGSWV